MKSLLLALMVFTALLPGPAAAQDGMINRQQFDELIDILQLTPTEREAATSLFEGFEVSLANVRAGLKTDNAALPKPTDPNDPDQREKLRQASFALTTKSLGEMAKLEEGLLNDLRAVAMAHPAEAWGEVERARERQRLLDEVAGVCQRVDLVQLWRRSGLSTETSKKILADWEIAIVPSLHEIASSRKDLDLHPPALPHVEGGKLVPGKEDPANIADRRRICEASKRVGDASERAVKELIDPLPNEDKLKLLRPYAACVSRMPTDSPAEAMHRQLLNAAGLGADQRDVLEARLQKELAREVAQLSLILVTEREREYSEGMTMLDRSRFKEFEEAGRTRDNARTSLITDRAAWLEWVKKQAGE